MKIGIQTWGSDGDILPFIALASGLKYSGHDVTVVYTSVDNKDYSSYGERFDISLIKAYEKFDEGKSRVFADIIASNDPLKQLALILENYFDPAVEEMYASSKRLCNECNLVIGHAIHYPLAIAAEKSECPRVPVVLCPMPIETKYVSPFGNNLGKWLNPFLWKLGDRIVRKKVYQSADRLRIKEGLAAFNNLQDDLYISKNLTLIATCKPLCPRPPDWGSNIQICGFLTPPKISEDWDMPNELQKFLAAAEPPVYFTFGSCTQFDIKGTTQLFLDATKKSGVRAIIQSDWDNFPMSAQDPNIYKVQSIPHEFVFPRCSMIVHHGGSGTTQSSLLAGKPSVVVTHAFDQSFWGKKLHEIGVAGKALQKQTITAEKLADSILAVLKTSDMSKRAEEVCQSIREENGVENAVSLIEDKFR
jgi:UDP:flavonoid glycosyltransferase YjiC (YdhE family)